MLQSAAAADAEMRTDRRDALYARLFDIEEMAPVGMAGDRLDFHRLARQRAWNVDRPTVTLGPIGHAVAAMAEPVDDKTLDRLRLNHVWPR